MMRVTGLLLWMACACAGAQVIMGGGGSNKQGAHFRYETRVEPEIPGQKLTGFGAGGIIVDTAFHRYLCDDAAKKYFGYDLVIDPDPGGTFRVTFRPLSLSTGKLGLKAAWSPIPLPQLPAPQVVRARDTIALDLFVHPVTGQKIVDYLFIQDDRAVLRLPDGPPRDYTVEDTPLTLSRVRLSMNGKPMEQWGGGMSGMSGEAVFFYLPGYGRYAFSLAPHEQLGFRKAGEVRGSTLTITVGTETFRLECDGPIAPGGGAYNLYVYHDPAWRPRSNPDGFLWGASDARSMVRPKP